MTDQRESIDWGWVTGDERLQSDARDDEQGCMMRDWLVRTEVEG